MSGEARVFAHGWRPARSRGAPTLRLAILELAERADHAGYVTACRVGDLADAIARDERTVPRVTAELVRAGVLSIQRRVLRGRGQVANVYRVLTDQMKVALANRDAQPEAVFSAAIEAALKGDADQYEL